MNSEFIEIISQYADIKDYSASKMIAFYEELGAFFEKKIKEPSGEESSSDENITYEEDSINEDALEALKHQEIQSLKAI